MKLAKQCITRSHVPSVSLLSQKAKKQFCIAVEEDMGAFAYIWFPPVKLGELESYWARQPAAGNSSPFF
jgi:hypothetical protein